MEDEDETGGRDLTGYRGEVKIEEWTGDEGGKKWAREKYGRDWRRMTIMTEVKERGEGEDRWIISFPENDSEPDGEMTGNRIRVLLSPRRGRKKTAAKKMTTTKTSKAKERNRLATSKLEMFLSQQATQSTENTFPKTPARTYGRKKRSRSTPQRQPTPRPTPGLATEQEAPPTQTPKKHVDKRPKISTSTQNTPSAKQGLDRETRETDESGREPEERKGKGRGDSQDRETRRSQETKEGDRQREQDAMDEGRGDEGAEAVLTAILAVRDFLGLGFKEVGMEEEATGGGYAWIRSTGGGQGTLEIRDLEALERLVGLEMAKKRSEGSMGENQSIDEWYGEREKSQQQVSHREHIAALELDLYKQAREIERLTGTLADRERKTEALQRKEAHAQAAAGHAQARITVADNVLHRLEVLENKMAAIQMRGGRGEGCGDARGETEGPRAQATHERDRDDRKHGNRKQGVRENAGWGPANYETLNSTAHKPYTKTQRAWGAGRLICSSRRADQHTPPTFAQPHPRPTTRRHHTAHTPNTYSQHPQDRVQTGDRANPAREVAIRGIPYRVGENLREIVRSIVHEAGLEPLEEREYDCIRALRKGRTQKDQESNIMTPRIIVTLASQKLKDALRRRPQQPLRVKHANIQGLDELTNNRQIYINENLTRDQGHLFYKARQSRTRMGWPYAWTANGAVLIRRREEWKAEEVRSVEDLDRLEQEETESTPPGDHPVLSPGHSRRSSVNLGAHNLGYRS